jgi:hypothetical protein
MREPVKVRLRIPLKVPGKNDLRPDPRVTYMGERPIPSAYLRWKGIERKWRRALEELRPRQDQVALGRRSLRFIRVMGPEEHKMDRWNVETGLNMVVVDMLVAMGWLIDDKEDFADMLPAVQRLAIGDEVAPATYIEIEDLPGPALATAALPGFEKEFG